MDDGYSFNRVVGCSETFLEQDDWVISIGTSPSSEVRAIPDVYSTRLRIPLRSSAVIQDDAASKREKAGFDWRFSRLSPYDWVTDVLVRMIIHSLSVSWISITQ
jgi:hypothetical protein